MPQSISNKQIVQFLLHVFFSVHVIDAFHLVHRSTMSTTSSCASSHRTMLPNCLWKNHHPKNTKIQINQSSNDNQEEEQELILGSSLTDALQGIGSEAGYLAAAKRRSEEGKARLAEQVRKEEEEAEALRRKKMEAGVEDNYGPGDLSGWKGFADDGFEASAGNDDTGGWGELKAKSADEESGDGEEEPKLFLFGDDDNSANGGLIL